jgi:hypothetical protein
MYGSTLARVARTAADAELKPHMQHSLRVLVDVASTRYAPQLLLVPTVAVLYLLARSWRRTEDARLRMGTLVIGSVLVNPHLYVYDASVLVLPALWLGDAFADDDGWLWPRCYLLTLLLLVPTAALIRVQLSVVVLLELLYQIHRRLPSAERARVAVAQVRVTD